MKRLIGISFFTLALGLCPSLCLAQPGGNAGFEKMKRLAGEWQATSPKDELFTSTIRLVSNGTAIEETFQNSEDDQMVTLYVPDGDRLAVTHYCSAGNQPRMETGPVTADQNEFAFSFVGITNLSGPTAGYMHHLAIQIADKDHFSEAWTWREKGKDKVETFHFTRKK